MILCFSWVRVLASKNQPCHEYAILAKWVYNIQMFLNIQNIIYSDFTIEWKISQKKFITRLWLGIVEMYHVTQFDHLPAGFISCYQTIIRCTNWNLYNIKTNFLVVRLIIFLMEKQIYIMTYMHVYSFYVLNFYRCYCLFVVFKL